MKQIKVSLYSILSIDNYLVLCLFLTLVLFLPEPLIIEAPTRRGYIISLFFNCVFCYSIVFCGIKIIQFISVISKWVAYSISAFCHLFIYVYSLLSLFLYLQFHLSLNEYAFQMFWETNREEARGFINTYCYTKEFFGIFIIFILLGAVEYYILSKCRKYNINIFATKQKYYFLFIFQGVIVVFMLLELRFFTPYYSYSQVYYDKADRWIIRTGPWKLVKSIYMFADLKSQMNRAIESQNIIVVDRYEQTSSKIILIIGESFNRHHSSLYGYELDTNPLLSKEKNLFVFNDVITHYNVTTHSFKYFMSMASAKDTIDWCDAPLFPLFFKETGYNVVFYSNQFFPTKANSHYEESSGFMCHPEISPKLFSSFNHTWHKYDLDLIEQYRRERDTLETDSLDLVIFHLNGQHVSAADKYPSFETFFTMKEITRPDLSTQEKQAVAEYDNACRYNDKVVENIIDIYRNEDAIIIYFADHGEEVNDFRSKIGRSFDFEEMGKEGIKCQLDIPFMIYMTDYYMETHPDVVSKVKNAINRPFMIDDLPHMLLEIAGINTRWYDPTKSLINENFNTSKKRIIYKTSIDYDEKTQS